MDKFLYDSVFRIGCIVSIFKNRNEKYCKETDSKKIKNKEISFREVLSEAMRNYK